jgi:hypothetical protein
MTKGAEHFVGRTTLSALASEPVQTSLWDEASPIPHTRLGQRRCGGGQEQPGGGEGGKNLAERHRIVRLRGRRDATKKGRRPPDREV